MCQCQTCTNFKGYQRVLSSLPKLFEAVTHPPEAVDPPVAGTANDDGEHHEEVDRPPPAEAWAGANELAALMAFCSLTLKSEMVNDVLCSGVLGLASSQPAAATAPSPKMLDCLNGKCSNCGFKKLWSEGLRRKLVIRRQRNGKAVDDLREDAPVEFQSQLK